MPHLRSHPRKPLQRPAGITLDIPSWCKLHLTHLIFDFNGTLALDGGLIRGVGTRLKRLARRFKITVLTADTFGTARAALRSLPVTTHVVASGADKAKFVNAQGGGVVAIGNGRNDVLMFRTATIAVAVIGPEGAAPELLGSATIVASDICHALDLLLYPQRLIATLRL